MIIPHCESWAFTRLWPLWRYCLGPCQQHARSLISNWLRSLLVLIVSGLRAAFAKWFCTRMHHREWLCPPPPSPWLLNLTSLTCGGFKAHWHFSTVKAHSGSDLWIVEVQRCGGESGEPPRCQEHSQSKCCARILIRPANEGVKDRGTSDQMLAESISSHYLAAL